MKKMKHTAEIHVRPFYRDPDEFGAKRRGYFVTLYRMGRRIKKGLAFTKRMADLLILTYTAAEPDATVVNHRVEYRRWKRR